ncbi:YciL protein [hydrothermal vent metagenome]|uniref:YciL protein n=1 Tax=hydrothermal vent metagenome TaxID=652676 RepID=A0A1W1DUY5_9ZZZZ
MLYAVISQDIENSLEKRMAVRPAHIERLNILKNEGRLILAGPHPAIDNNEPGEAGFTGSLVVAEFDSLEDAQAWADADPYLASGAYESVVVKPFKKVLP